MSTGADQMRSLTCSTLSAFSQTRLLSGNGERRLNRGIEMPLHEAAKAVRMCPGQLLRLPVKALVHVENDQVVAG